MSIETLELIIKLVFPICTIIMIRGFINMEFIKKSENMNSDNALISVALMFFGFFALLFFYYPECIRFNEFNMPGFLVFLSMYSFGRLLYATS